MRPRKPLTETHKKNIGLGVKKTAEKKGPKTLTEAHKKDIGLGVRKAAKEGRCKKKPGFAPWNKGLTYTSGPCSDTRKLGISIANTGHIVTEETRRILAIVSTGKIQSKETKRKNSETNIKRLSDPLKRKELSIKRTEKWREPEYRKNQILSMKGCRDRRPNNPETLIDLITQEYFTGWQYCGDYSVVINGKNPDFINFETKQIIEFYGDYWHEGEDPTDKAQIFADAGYELCVIWEHELQDLDEVIMKLRRFCGRDF